MRNRTFRQIQVTGLVSRLANIEPAAHFEKAVAGQHSSAWPVVVLLALAGVGAVTADRAPADDSPALGQARRYLQLLVKGEFNEFCDAGTDVMREQFPADKARQAWATLVLQLGVFQSEISASETTAGDFAVVDLKCAFKRGKCTLRFSLDAKQRLAGFFCMSIERQVDYEPPTYVDPSAYREIDVTVSAGKYPLPARLTLPDRSDRIPGVVLVHGSGPHDENETIGPNQPFRDIAGGLSSRGVAVLRYVKRTQAHPWALPPADWTLETETVEDAVAAVALLRQRPEVDPQRVFVVGHSMGGMAAPFIAARDGRLAGIISLAGSARPVLDLLEEQTKYLASLQSSISPDQQKEIEKVLAGIAAVRAGRVKDVPTIAGAPSRYWAHLDALRPAEAAAGLEIPMLFIQGGRDYQVTLDDLAIWKRALEPRDDVVFRVFEDLNHLFVAGEGRSTPAEYMRTGHVDVQVIEAMARWIESAPPAE